MHGPINELRPPAPARSGDDARDKELIAATVMRALVEEPFSIDRVQSIWVNLVEEPDLDVWPDVLVRLDTPWWWWALGRERQAAALEARLMRDLRMWVQIIAL